MSAKYVEIECCLCGHTWVVDLEKLDQVELITYKGIGTTPEYRAQCPNCDTYNVFSPPEETR
ncbi:MAG: hypothetical protein ACP5J4_18470 [Anaerolineae bacterium]